jgi:hypothetical protein
MKKPKNADDYDWDMFKEFLKADMCIRLDDPSTPLYWKFWKAGYKDCDTDWQAYSRLDYC